MMVDDIFALRWLTVYMTLVSIRPDLTRIRSRDNDRYYLDFLAVKTLTNVISLIGNLASSVIVHILLFNDSSVVRLKEYKEIHKEARLL